MPTSTRTSRIFRLRIKRVYMISTFPNEIGSSVWQTISVIQQFPHGWYTPTASPHSEPAAKKTVGSRDQAAFVPVKPAGTARASRIKVQPLNETARALRDHRQKSRRRLFDFDASWPNSKLPGQTRRLPVEFATFRPNSTLVGQIRSFLIDFDIHSPHILTRRGHVSTDRTSGVGRGV